MESSITYQVEVEQDGPSCTTYIGWFLAAVVLGLITYAVCRYLKNLSSDSEDYTPISYKDVTNWTSVGTGTLSAVSSLGTVVLPLEQGRGLRGEYLYRLVLPHEGQYIYLSGFDKAYTGQKKYILTDQLFPPEYGGAYTISLKETFPYGFKVPGYANIGRVASVYLNGKVGPHDAILQSRPVRLNNSRFQYRVLHNDGTYTMLPESIHQLHDNEVVPPASPHLTSGVVAYKVRLEKGMVQ